MSDDGMKIKITKDGPYTVFGEVPLKEETVKIDAMGRPDRWEDVKKLYPGEVYALCRCGKSRDKPFCTGDHVGFDGTETAKRNTFEERAAKYPGAEGVVVMQDISLCVGAGFCHARHNINKTAKDKNTLDIALQQSYDCAGGSIVIKVDGEAREPQLERSISTTVMQSITGPLWVKGGIQVESSDGYKYEVRNRVNLCSCGRSKNKPFCDGEHKR
jgi:CDGSH-type Zn-finger protein